MTLSGRISAFATRVAQEIKLRGLPSGGSPGQVVVKSAPGDYLTGWADIAVSGRFLVETDEGYPERPDDDPVVFIGETNPDTLGLMLPGDTWVSTSEEPLSLDPLVSSYVSDGDSATRAALDDWIGPRVIPVTSVGSTWPARPTTAPGDVVLWIGDPTGSAPSGMLDNDIWTREPVDLPGVWQPYTPTFTNVTLGDGTVEGAYQRTGDTVDFRIRLVIGSTTSITSTLRMSLPVPAATTPAAGTSTLPLGSALMNDVSASSARISGVTTLFSGGLECYVNATQVASYTTTTTVNATVPFTWAVGDSLTLSGTYQVA